MQGKLNRRDQQLSRAFSAEVHLNLVRSDYLYPKDPYFSLKISYWYNEGFCLKNRSLENAPKANINKIDVKIENIAPVLVWYVYELSTYN